ncbi:MAG: T9SS type A sorting domain-containing protein [Bacteroidales bacterium]|jgi:hypothetical protein|nr:T9SS type A sorting domain-containing protein [Bacteroidales bacterium]
MKKYILIFALLIICCLLQAQEYQPFPREKNTFWRHAWESFYSMDREYYQYTITGDTIINGITYHKLWYTSESYIVENGYTTYESKYGGVFREDTANKKIYGMRANTSEYMLYDFNLNVGDTIYTSSDDEQVFFVSAIDSLLLGDGKYHKKFIIDVENCPYPPDDEHISFMIEGIGGAEGLFPISYDCRRHDIRYLQCVATENYSIYGGHCPSIDVSISEFEKNNNVNIYPNPAQTSLTIDFTETYTQISRIDIFNMQGQCVKSIPAVQFKQHIDVGELANGIYLVRLQTKQKESFYKKLVIIK